MQSTEQEEPGEQIAVHPPASEQFIEQLAAAPQVMSQLSAPPQLKLQSHIWQSNWQDSAQLSEQVPPLQVSQSPPVSVVLELSPSPSPSPSPVVVLVVEVSPSPSPIVVPSPVPLSDSSDAVSSSFPDSLEVVSVVSSVLTSSAQPLRVKRASNGVS